MSQAMRGVTKALVAVNKKMDIPALQKLMTEFMRENERAEFTQEAMGDAIDDALEEPGSADQENLIINQVLDELGIQAADKLAAAPTRTAEPAAKQGDSYPLFRHVSYSCTSQKSLH